MKNNRLEREKRTVLAMIEIFCRANHGSTVTLCDDCQQLYHYGLQRIDKCPYHEDKPTCAKCPIHCYNPAMRLQIRQIMRFSGPRMILSHPWLTIGHYIDEFSKTKTEKIIKRN